MSYPELNRRCAVAVKVETTAGTYDEPSFSTDAIRCIGASEPEELYLSPNDRDDHQTGGLGTLPGAAPAGRHWRFRLQFAVSGAGAAYSASVLPPAAALLRAAGMTQAIVTTLGSETATYRQNDDPTTTVSAKLRISGKEYAVRGAVCESLSGEVNAAGMLIVDAVVIGVHQALTETALGSVTYPSVNPAIWKGANSLVIGAYSPVGRTLRFDLGLQSEPNVSANADDGLVFFKIVRRRPVLTVMGRIPALATWNPKDQLNTRAVVTLDATVGATQYNRLKIDVDNGSYIDVQDVPDGEMRTYEAQILAGVHATNELTFVFD